MTTPTYRDEDIETEFHTWARPLANGSVEWMGEILADLAWRSTGTPVAGEVTLAIQGLMGKFAEGSSASLGDEALDAAIVRSTVQRMRYKGHTVTLVGSPYEKGGRLSQKALIVLVVEIGPSLIDARGS